MRGDDQQQDGVFSYVSLEQRVPRSHPLRAIRAMVDEALRQLERSGLLSDKHFTVDGTMLEAWANRRSFREKAEPPERGSGHGGKRLLRDTHESGTDPEARLYRKCNAGAAKPCCWGTC